MSFSAPGPSSPPSARRLHWLARTQAHGRYAHESNKEPSWFTHSKHFFIFSWAGRPIFSRYGDESALSAFTGVLTAIVENFRRIAGDGIGHINAGIFKFVFMLAGPIYLVCISRTGESASSLRSQLAGAHSQVLSVLTGSVRSLLESKPQYDIRNLMGGTESLLSDLLSECDRSYCFLLDAISVVRVAKATRAKIAAALRKAGGKSLLYGILLYKDKLIHVVRGKDRVLHPSDLLLLMNFLTNSQSLRSAAESWAPICLPRFSDKGFLYAYINFLMPSVPDLCLCLISGDSNDFLSLRVAKQRIAEQFDKKGVTEELEKFAWGTENFHLPLEEMEIANTELRHFVYRSAAHSQLLMSPLVSPFSGRVERKQLFRKYQQIHHRIHINNYEELVNPPTPSPAAASSVSAGRHNKRYFEYWDSSDRFTVLALVRPGDHDLYCAFTGGVEKDAAWQIANKAVRWIKKEEANLFI